MTDGAVDGSRINITSVHVPCKAKKLTEKDSPSIVSTMMDGEVNGDSFIMPSLDDDNLELTQSCNWPDASPTSVKKSNVTVNNGDIVSTTVALRFRVNSEDSVPSHLASLDDTNLKDDASVVDKSVPKLSDHTTDKDDDRVQISQASSPPSTPTKSLRKTKEHILILCLVLFAIATVTLFWQLNEATTLNLQLQAEQKYTNEMLKDLQAEKKHTNGVLTDLQAERKHMNGVLKNLQADLDNTNGVLNDCRSNQAWMLNEETKEDTNLIKIENCWFEASVNLGPCTHDPLGNANNAYKQTYQDVSSYIHEAWNWWTDLPNDSNDSNETKSSDPLDSAEKSWFDQASNFVSLNAKELSAGIGVSK